MDSWKLMSKYSKKFVKAGVKLRQTTFNVWMEFAAKIGLQISCTTFVFMIYICIYCLNVDGGSGW
jgi:hypothetical protein